MKITIASWSGSELNDVMWAASGPVMALLGLGLSLLLLYRLIACRKYTLPVTAEWLNELSPQRYSPMLRLLCEDDLRFLRTQPGFIPQLETKLRAQRCQIFRGYLRCLVSDFERTCVALKLLMVNADRDRPDLASVIMQSRLRFAYGVAAIECRLVLYLWGLGGVEVGGLVKLFDSMRLELRALVPAAQSMAVRGGD